MKHHNKKQGVETIGRYLCQCKFKSLLNEKALYFTPLRVFTDKYEGFIYEEYFNQLRYTISMHWHGHLDDGEQNTVYTLENAIRHIKDSTFVSCWRIGSTPSPQMWKEYIGECDGVLIIVDRESLLEQLRLSALSGQFNLRSNTVSYGDFSKVSYKPTTRGETPDPFSHLMLAPDVLSVLETGDFLFSKAEKFNFEQEYRIIVSRNYDIDFDSWRSASKSIGAEYATMGALDNLRIDGMEEYEQAMASPPPEGVRLAIPLEEIVRRIIFKPGVSDDYITSVHKLISDNGLDILHSKLIVGDS